MIGLVGEFCLMSSLFSLSCRIWELSSGLGLYIESNEFPDNVHVRVNITHTISCVLQYGIGRATITWSPIQCVAFESFFLLAGLIKFDRALTRIE